MPEANAIADPASTAAPAATPDVTPADKPVTDPAPAKADAAPADPAPGTPEAEAAAKAAADAIAKANVAPEKYEAFKEPEGVKLAGEVVEQFESVAKELNLPQDKAQLVIDKLAPVIAKQNAAAIDTALNEASTAWETSAKADKELAEGNFDANLATAKKALDTYGTPELKQLLDDSKLGNHPEVIRWMLRVGKTIQQDDKHITGTQTGTGGKTIEQRLWGEKTS